MNRTEVIDGHPTTAHDGMSISARSGRLVLSPEGELDLVTGPPLAAAARQVIIDSAAAASDGQAVDHAARLVVGLGRITFIDSAGVKCLLAIHRAAQAHGMSAELSEAHPHVRKVLTLLGIDREIPLQARTAD